MYGSQSCSPQTANTSMATIFPLRCPPLPHQAHSRSINKPRHPIQTCKQASYTEVQGSLCLFFASIFKLSLSYCRSLPVFSNKRKEKMSHQMQIKQKHVDSINLGPISQLFTTSATPGHKLMQWDTSPSLSLFLGWIRWEQEEEGTSKSRLKSGEDNSSRAFCS